MKMANDEHHAKFHCLGPVKEKDRSPKVFVFVRGTRKVLVSDAGRAELFGRVVNSQVFREINRTSFCEGVKAQS